MIDIKDPYAPKEKYSFLETVIKEDCSKDYELLRINETREKYRKASEELIRNVFSVYDSVQLFPSSALDSILDQKANIYSSENYINWDNYDFFSQTTLFYDFSDSTKLTVAALIYPRKVHMIAFDSFIVSTEKNIGKRNKEEKVREIMHRLQEKNFRFTHIVRSDERHTDRESSFLKADIYEVKHE